MTEKTVFLPSCTENLKIGIRIYEAKTPKAVMQICHGMTEHSLRYLDFIKFLVENNITCVAADHRGHGLSVKSEEDLGYFYKEGAQGVIEDMRIVNTYIKESYPDLPLIMLGHSMGSFAVRGYARLYDSDIDGLIVCGSPAYNAAADIGIFLCKVIALFKGERYRSKLVTGMSIDAYNRAVPNAKTAFDWLSRNTERVESYIADPWCGFTFTLNGYIALFNLMKYAYAKNGWVTENKALPIFFISGEDDPCRGGDKGFIGAVNNILKHYQNVDYKVYQNMRHEILGETDKITVYNDVLDRINRWIEK